MCIVYAFQLGATYGDARGMCAGSAMAKFRVAWFMFAKITRRMGVAFCSSGGFSLASRPALPRARWMDVHWLWAWFLILALRVLEEALMLLVQVLRLSLCVWSGCEWVLDHQVLPVVRQVLEMVH
jgi:hypothetical protein